MTDDLSADIDSILASKLPDQEPDDVPSELDPRQAQMVQLLKEAADELDKSPTFAEFNALEYDVSADLIKYKFGTWNEAKEAAGLEVNSRGEHSPTNINETYFQSIDTSAKAYWFGTLIATSSIQHKADSDQYLLSLGRTEQKAHFVIAFADAIDSEYAIHWQGNSKTDNQQVQTLISNRRFVENLLEAGYPRPGDDASGFPDIPEQYTMDFTRGFLESSGYFRTNGWQIRLECLERGETLQDWFQKLGAKRPTVSQPQDNSVYVRVTNPFDVASVFESLYPELLDTEPSWTPYPKRIMEFLAEEHPYPENLEYVDR